MSTFTQRSDWCCRSGRYKHTTCGNGLKWERDFKGSNLWIHVPANFAFEASIPWYARPILNPNDDRFLAAACLHDYVLHVLGWNRGAAAGVFFDALKADGVSDRKATVMTAVTLQSGRVGIQ